MKTIKKQPQKKKLIKKSSTNKQAKKINVKETKKSPKERLHFSFKRHQQIMNTFQKNIQKEIARHWHPPIGVPKGSECIIHFVINPKGDVDQFKILKHSKILIYDLSIIRVAKKFRFDKRLWGKQFSINFYQ